MRREQRIFILDLKPHGKGAKGCEKGVQPVNTNDVLRQEYRPTLIVVQNVGLMRS